MDDMIYRQAAIDEIEYEIEMINSALDSITLDFNARERLRQRRGEAREILNSIQQLPSAQPEQRWIPCSERLPEKDGRYQVTRHDDVTNTEFIDILWYEDNLWWNRHSTGNYAVTAWMPLPEPYRGEGEQA